MTMPSLANAQRMHQLGVDMGDLIGARSQSCCLSPCRLHDLDLCSDRYLTRDRMDLQEVHRNLEPLSNDRRSAANTPDDVHLTSSQVSEAVWLVLHSQVETTDRNVLHRTRMGHFKVASSRSNNLIGDASELSGTAGAREADLRRAVA